MLNKIAIIIFILLMLPQCIIQYVEIYNYLLFKYSNIEKKTIILKKEINDYTNINNILKGN